jgi:hypothetical protein
VRWVIGCFLSLVGCRGEQVDAAVPPDAALDAGETSTTDAGCPTGAMNLLVNPGFETWTGDVPENWSVNTDVIGVERVDDDAGTTAVRITVKKYGNGLYQTINLPEPLPKGCKLRLSARTRYVSGPTSPTPDLFMYMFDASGNGPSGTGDNFPSYSAAWSSHSTTFTADRTVTKVQAYVLGNAMGATQVFDFDDAVVTYEP